ncbi:MAG: hypothetical protein AABO58_24555 [Acidobacteriota bacterium]
MLLAVSLAALVIGIFAAWYEHEAAGNPVDRAVGGGTDEAVRIQGHISADRVEPGQKNVDCWFVVQNAGDVPITDLRLRKWTASGFQPAEFEPKTGQPLGARQILFFRPRGPLTASMTPQRFLATAEFEWLTGNVTHQQPFSLGPITVRSATEPRIYSVSKAVVGHLKDFVLPFMLLAMTFLITRQQRDSEKTASWNLMVPKIHDYTGQYYMPYFSAAAETAAAFKAADVNNPDSFNRITFQLLLFRKRSRILYERVGGFYLRSQPGEQLVADCEDAFLTALHPHVDRLLLGEAKDSVGRYTELHVFNRNGIKVDAVRKVRQGLIDWKKMPNGEMETALIPLSLLADIIAYEVNLTLRFWYGSDLSDLEARTDDMKALSTSKSESLKRIAELYEDYLRKMKDYKP